jgi:hypothetical protein
MASGYDLGVPAGLFWIVVARCCCRSVARVSTMVEKRATGKALLQTSTAAARVSSDLNGHRQFGMWVPILAIELGPLSTRLCSLIPGLGVKLSTIVLAGPTVLSAVGACPPHDGVRRRWRINVASAVALSGARKKSDDLTTAIVPAGTTFPAVGRELYALLCALSGEFLL